MRFRTSIYALIATASVSSCIATDPQTDPRITKLITSDDARITAMQNPSEASLDAIFSNDLRYAHSNGNVDTKASLCESLLQGRLKYLSIRPEERTFTFPADSIALMSGKAQIKVGTTNGEVELHMIYLAVWRLENEQWKFLAWQSCRLNPPPAK